MSLSIESNLSYNASSKERSFLNTSNNTINSNAIGKIVRTTINNAREIEPMAFDDCGFQLVNHTTSMSTNDFYNNTDSITSIYYNEICQLIKDTTNATDCIIYHHQIRNNDKKDSNSNVQGYANGVHTDYTSYSANHLFLSLYQSEQQPKKGRYAIINAWRNISDIPIQQNDLAICDERSLIKPDDYIELEFITNNYSTLQYRLNDINSKHHRWYYYPKMTKDEVLLFKQYDSKTDITGRYCFHTSLNSIVSLDEVYNTRESIEIRAIVFYNDDDNTCPERIIGYDYINNKMKDDDDTNDNTTKSTSILSWLFNTSPDISIDEGCKRVENSIVYLSYWPKEIVAYIKAGKHRPEASLELATALADDKKNHLKMRHLSKEKKAAIVKSLMERGWDEKFKVAFA